MLNGPTLLNGDLEMQNSSTIGVEVSSACSGKLMTPTCLRLLYKTWNYVPQATSTNKLGITGYDQQYASQSDLTKFLDLYRSDAASAQLSVVTVHEGINNQSNPGGEVRLVLHVRMDGCNTLSHRPTSIPNTLSRSSSRLRSPFTAQGAFHPTSLMTKPSQIRTSHTWTGSILSWTRRRSHRRSVPHMATTSRPSHRTMRNPYATCLLNLVRGESAFLSRVVTLASAAAVDHASQMMVLTKRNFSRYFLHRVSFIYIS